MISPYVKKLARETGKSEKEISGFWEKAKKITSETFGIEEDEFTTEHYEFAITTVKNMLGLSEDIVNPTNFLKSDLEAKDYIETVVSGNFSVGDKNPIIPPKGKKIVDLDDEEEKKKSKKENYVINDMSKEGLEEVKNYLEDSYEGTYNKDFTKSLIIEGLHDSRLDFLLKVHGATQENI